MALEDDSTFDSTPISAPIAGPSRRSTLAYYSTAAKRSFLDAFSKQKLIDAVKAFFWVAPLTILIWIYAEREQLTTYKNFPIPVDVRSNDPKQVITVIRPGDGSLTADITGPRARLDRVREDFSRRADVKARIEIGTVTPGQHQIEAGDVSEDDRFAGNGVMLNNLQPRVLEIYVDVLDEMDIPVALPPGITNLANATFTPATVKISAPRSALDSASKPLVAYVDPNALQQFKANGSSQPTEVKALRLVTPLKDAKVRLSPSAVNATFEVRSADVGLTLSSIPVWVTFAPGLEAQYKVEYEPSVANVTVTGSADVINAIKAGTATVRPKATFEVSKDNVTPGNPPQKAKLKYDLPEGVQVKPEDAQRTIDFKLVERSAVE